MRETMHDTTALVEPIELTEAELDAVAAGASLVNISGNHVEVGAQVQVLTNRSGQQQNI